MSGIGKFLGLLAAACMVGGGIVVVPTTEASAQITIPLPFIGGGPSIRFDPNYHRAPAHRAAKSHNEDTTPAKEKDATEEEINASSPASHQSPTGPARDVSHSVETDAPARTTGGGGPSKSDQPSFTPSR